MIKVKEFLDKYFVADPENSCYLKANNKYNVQGEWWYKKEICQCGKNFFTKHIKNGIHICINNETLYRINVIMDEEYQDTYGYLQTYDHITRGEPDENGFYKRSTDEEIIKYIQNFMIQLDIVQEIKYKTL